MGVKRINSTVKTSDIKFDVSLYPRAGHDWRTSYDYAQSMKSGAVFPPVILAKYNNQLILVDGKHRLEAYKTLKIDTVKAEVYIGWSKKKIFEEAIRYNISHGRVLSPYEKRMLALKLRQFGYNDAQVSELIQVPLDKVESFVAQRLVNAITGDVECEAIIKGPLKHLAGQTVSEGVIESQKMYYSRNQVTLLEHLIRIIESNELDSADPKVSGLIDRLKELLV